MPHVLGLIPVPSQDLPWGWAGWGRPIWVKGISVQAALGHVLYTWGTEAIAEWLGLWRPSGPVSLPKQGHLEQVTQHHAHGLLWAFSFNHQYCATTKRSVVEQSHQKFTHNSFAGGYCGFECLGALLCQGGRGRLWLTSANLLASYDVLFYVFKCVKFLELLLCTPRRCISTTAVNLWNSSMLF